MNDTDDARLMGGLDPGEVSNVFVYVGDAVRWDHLPESVAEQGSVAKTVAASTFSPSSFATLATGLYPPALGVRSFEDRIPDDVFRLFDLRERGYETRFVNSMRETHDGADPVYSVLDESPPATPTPLADLNEPFVVVERGPGGHAPYDDTLETGAAYFRSRGSDAERLREEYAGAVARDASLFHDRVETLTRKGLRDETLVIYTSDHGELLGEGGMLGHNAPMRPELVYVPTVFVHSSIDAERRVSPFHHVDLVPTVLTAIKESIDRNFDGQSAFRGPRTTPGLSFYDWRSLPDRVPGVSGRLWYEGAWDADGGLVFPRSGRVERTSALLGKVAGSPKRSFLRHNISAATRSYLAGVREYGDPDLDRTQAKQALRAVRTKSRQGDSVDLSAAAERRLEDLGYR